jgi:TPP-dependent 2-oxoacid decarboxylase
VKELIHFPATLSGLSSIGCWDELRAGYGADGVGACVVAFTVPIAGAYSENLPVIGLLDFVL